MRYAIIKNQTKYSLQEGMKNMTVKRGTVKKKSAKPAPKKSAKKALAKKTVGPPKKKALKKMSMPPASTAPKPVRISAATQKRHQLLKKILFKKRNEVVEGLEHQMERKLTRETGQKIDSAMDSADLSALDVDQVIDYSLLEMKYEQYKDIADAFRKLQSKSYGLCEECGQEISIKRLEVNPLARYCIECKTHKEEIEKIQKEETRFKD
jgi:DnaK suppressor protein